MDLLNEGNQSSQQSAQTATPVYAHNTSDSDTASRVEALIAELRASGRDITADYGDWLKVGFALASEFGESGRRYFHDISSIYSGYERQECDKKYDQCLKSDNGKTNIATLFYLAEQQGVRLPHQEHSSRLNKVLTNTDATSDKNVALSFIESQEEDRRLPLFDETIYNDLPIILERATGTMNIRQEKDLVLIGSIATISSILLPFRTIYHGRTIFPNMFLFVPGPAGSGKGRLDFCYRLVRPIHQDKRDLWLLAQEEYKQELDRYRALSKKEKANATSPVKPPITLLRVPANCSATSFAEAMADNGNMLMFETEGDTVVNTFKSDYGNYSDNFRKAFAHEEFGYLRRGNDSEEKEVQNPRLSVVLSGTPEQVKSLIPNAENGLLSRFIFYCMSATDEWLDGFSGYDTDNPLEKVFDNLGAEIENFYQHLTQINEVWFTLSIVQKLKFNDYFAGEKQRMKELNGDLYNASTHRLSWACLRIAMVLTALRCMDRGTVPEKIECSDADFDIALSIIRTVSEHNDYIFNVLNEGITEDVKVSETYSSAARHVLLNNLPDKFSSEDMQSIAVKLGKSIRTIQRQVRRAIQNGQVKELAKGRYEQVK
ncbi:MAG: DUF3987 domain-containing protein [Candidatus Cryptobacteroides sp.]|nr:DUF3987 domain-containing protein [Candidatus Cryptobacteroides sp.]